MPVTYTSKAVTADASDASSYTSPAFSVEVGKLYLIGLHVKRSDATDPPTLSTISCPNLNITQIQHAPYDLGAGTHRGRGYLLVGACTATSASVQVSVTLSATASDLGLTVDEVTGAPSTTADAIVQSVTAGGNSQTATSTLAALASTANSHYMLLTHGWNLSGYTAEAGATKLSDYFFASAFAGGGALHKDNDTVLQASTTTTTNNVGSIGVEIKAGKTLSVSGAITPTGTLAKSMSKTLAGAITPTGALALLVTRVVNLAGSITPTGTLAKSVSKTLGGSITPTGTMLTTYITQFLSPLVTGTLNLIAQAAAALHLTPESGASLSGAPMSADTLNLSPQGEDTLHLDPLEEDDR